MARDTQKIDTRVVDTAPWFQAVTKELAFAWPTDIQ